MNKPVEACPESRSFFAWLCTRMEAWLGGVSDRSSLDMSLAAEVMRIGL
jgi:hypothetical protein